jgi:hypothetical protein
MSWYDANWLDASCVVVGVINVFFQRFRLRFVRSRWTGKQYLFAFFNGLGVPPLVVLTAATFSSGLLYFLTNSSRVTLPIAGVSGLLALLDLQGQIVPARRTARRQS